MPHIVLDSDIIVNHPEILSYSREGTKLIVPDVVLEEILNFQSTSGRQLGALLQNAQEQNIIFFSGTISPKEKLQGTVLVNFSDYTIAGYAKYLQEQGNDVVLATEEKKLITFARSNGIQTFDWSALIAHLSTNSRKVESIENQAERIESKARWSILVNIVIAILLLLLFIWFIRKYGDSLTSFANLFWVAFLVLIGFALFEVRQKRRQLYGFVEIGFGILTIAVCFYPSIILANWDFYLKIVAGLYVIVRGLDNVQIGSDKKSLGTIIKKLFRF